MVGGVCVWGVGSNCLCRAGSAPTVFAERGLCPGCGNSVCHADFKSQEIVRNIEQEIPNNQQFADWSDDDEVGTTCPGWHCPGCRNSVCHADFESQEIVRNIEQEIPILTHFDVREPFGHNAPCQTVATGPELHDVTHAD